MLLTCILVNLYSAIGRVKHKSEFGFESALQLAQPSADGVFRETEFHTVGAAMRKAQDETEMCTSGRRMSCLC